MAGKVRAAVIISVVSVVALSGCAGGSGVREPTDACDQAFTLASERMNTLYATHPFYGDEYDAMYADGEISADEQTRLDEMMADEEAQYNALILPVTEACHGVEDLYAGAFAHRDDADWALQESSYVSREEAKTYFVVAYCTSFPASNACADYDARDWR